MSWAIGLKEVVKILIAERVDFVLPGAEAGVEAADQISEALGLKTSNGTRLSAARRDKYLMVEALRSAGLQTVRHFKSRSSEAILSWVEALGKFPVVVKPVKSSGADAVAICDDIEQVRDASRRILGTTNQIGFRNDEVIIQAFLRGTEYIVNTVSSNGSHRICDVWRCKKEKIAGAGFISCLEELVDPSDECVGRLIDYAFKSLDALAIKFGPAHFEIMDTQDGPILVEVGARIQGAINPSSIQAATGTSQVEMTLDAYLRPNVFNANKSVSFLRLKAMFHAFMVSDVEGILRRLPRLGDVQAMPSFFHYSPRFAIGQQITRTTDLFSSVGVIDFLHFDHDVVRQDYERFRSFEREGFYEL